MNNFKLAYRNLFRKKQNTIIKIISLGTGLAVGLVLLSKVSFELNYDDFYPDLERIYCIETKYVKNNEAPEKYPQISGAIAPGMKAEVPGVEVATRFTYLTWDDATFYTQDKKRYKGSFIMADENFFDVLPLPMIAGNAKEVLLTSMNAMVSQSLAKKMGENVIGKIIQLETYPGKEITIRGVFTDVPENSSFKYDIIVSLESIGKFNWDGRNNWEGNDRYIGFVKLEKGINPEQLYPAIQQMQEKNQPLEEFKKAGVELSYILTPLSSLYSNSETVKNFTLILSIIAFVLLLTTILNYLLIVITSLIQRNKEFAVKKCFGSTEKNLIQIISVETLFNFILALIFSLIFLLVFRSTVEEVLGASLESLFSSKTMLLLFLVCLIMIVISIFFPVHSLQKISPAVAFRNSKHSKQSWKLALLLVQFASAAFLLLLTAMISKQYHFMITDNPGYEYKNVLYIELSGIDSIGKYRLMNELQKNSEVETISLCTSMPLETMSGNNVYVERGEQELFNIADMYYTDEMFIPLMQIPIIAGNNFDKNSDNRDALVSESFRNKMKTMLNWNDVVGKDVFITEHGLTHIIGVFDDFRIGSMKDQDTRPAVMFFYGDNHERLEYLLVKLRNISSNNIQEINNIASNVFPEREISFTFYEDSFIKNYNFERLFRNGITIGGIITLIISLIGLIGYVNNEISLRTAEIAIRKINGATLRNILTLFVRKIFYISIPAMIIGCIAAYFAGNYFMSNFSNQVDFSIGEYLLYTAILLVIIISVVILNCIKIANQNPIDSLRKE